MPDAIQASTAISRVAKTPKRRPLLTVTRQLPTDAFLLGVQGRVVPFMKSEPTAVRSTCGELPLIPCGGSGCSPTPPNWATVNPALLCCLTVQRIWARLSAECVMLRFAFHTPGADVKQGMRAQVTSVPLRHRANHRSAVAERRFRPIRCHRVEVSAMTRDGVRLAVRDGGPRQAEHTVVFLHGFCLTGASWSHQIDYLLRRYGEHVRVISYDHRGHGR